MGIFFWNLENSHGRGKPFCVLSSARSPWIENMHFLILVTPLWIRFISTYLAQCRRRESLFIYSVSWRYFQHYFPSCFFCLLLWPPLPIEQNPQWLSRASPQTSVHKGWIMIPSSPLFLSGSAPSPWNVCPHQGHRRYDWQLPGKCQKGLRIREDPEVWV